MEENRQRIVAKALNAQPRDDSRGYKQSYKQIANVAKERSFGNQIKPVSGQNKWNSKYLEYAIHTVYTIVYEYIMWSCRLMKIKV